MRSAAGGQVSPLTQPHTHTHTSGDRRASRWSLLVVIYTPIYSFTTLKLCILYPAHL